MLEWLIAIAVLGVVDRCLRGVVVRQAALGFRLRVASVSFVVCVMGGLWAVERAPW